MDVPASVPVSERHRAAALKWEADVSPAVEELRSRVESDGFLRRIVQVSGSGPEPAIGLGLGLTTAIAAGTLGITALAGLGVAALPIIIKAAALASESKKANRANGAYLIIEMERRFRQRGTR
jgi:hypothetical protein